MTKAKSDSLTNRAALTMPPGIHFQEVLAFQGFSEVSFVSNLSAGVPFGHGRDRLLRFPVARGNS